MTTPKADPQIGMEEQVVDDADVLAKVMAWHSAQARRDKLKPDWNETDKA